MIELWDNRRVHRLVRTLETKVEAETMIADQKVNLKRYDKISAVLQDAEGQLENEEDKMDTNEHAAVNAVTHVDRMPQEDPQEQTDAQLTGKALPR